MYNTLFYMSATSQPQSKQLATQRWRIWIFTLHAAQ